MGDLVTDGGGGGIAIDERVVQILIAHSGHTENGGGKNDLVVRWLIVGVVSLRRHFPLAAVHRFAKFPDHLAELPAGGIHQVSAPRIRAHDQCRIVFPTVGIADFDGEFVELLARLGLGGVAHPIQPINPLAIRTADDLHQLRVALLHPRREILLHENFPRHHAHRDLLGIQHPLPTGSCLFLTGEHFPVEGEVFLLPFLA